MSTPTELCEFTYKIGDLINEYNNLLESDDDRFQSSHLDLFRKLKIGMKDDLLNEEQIFELVLKRSKYTRSDVERAYCILMFPKEDKTNDEQTLNDILCKINDAVYKEINDVRNIEIETGAIPGIRASMLIDTIDHLMKIEFINEDDKNRMMDILFGFINRNEMNTIVCNTEQVSLSADSEAGINMQNKLKSFIERLCGVNLLNSNNYTVRSVKNSVIKLFKCENNIEDDIRNIYDNVCSNLFNDELLFGKRIQFKDVETIVDGVLSERLETTEQREFFKKHVLSKVILNPVIDITGIGVGNYANINDSSYEVNYWNDEDEDEERPTEIQPLLSEELTNEFPLLSKLKYRQMVYDTYSEWRKYMELIESSSTTDEVKVAVERLKRFQKLTKLINPGYENMTGLIMKNKTYVQHAVELVLIDYRFNHNPYNKHHKLIPLPKTEAELNAINKGFSYTNRWFLRYAQDEVIRAYLETIGSNDDNEIELPDWLKIDEDDKC